MSYERASAFLGDVLPIDAVPSSSSIKAQVRKIGNWIDQDTHQQAENFFHSEPLRLPDPPLDKPRYALELDAGYIRAIPAKCDGRRTFAIIAARLRKPEAPSASIAFVNEQTLSPLTRLHHFLHRQAVPIDAPLAIISDGGEDVAYPSYLPWRPVRRVLDWFHISMRFEHLLQRIRGLRHAQPDEAATLIQKVESAKWRPWHGRAKGCIERLRAVAQVVADKLHACVKELINYLQPNQDRLIDYGARYRAGLAISTSLAESAVNFVIDDRFEKKRQMRWTPAGANAQLHIRVADLNGELAHQVKTLLQAQPSVANHECFAMAP